MKTSRVGKTEAVTSFKKKLKYQNLIGLTFISLKLWQLCPGCSESWQHALWTLFRHGISAGESGTIPERSQFPKVVTRTTQIRNDVKFGGGARTWRLWRPLVELHLSPGLGECKNSWLIESWPAAAGHVDCVWLLECGGAVLCQMALSATHALECQAAGKALRPFPAGDNGWIMSHSRLAVLLLSVASRVGPTALLEGLHFGTVRLGPSRRTIEGQKLKYFYLKTFLWRILRSEGLYRYLVY